MNTCPDCGVDEGKMHHANCDIARCLDSGGQRFGCGCGHCGKDVWTGRWPGTAECEEYGLWAVLEPGKGWIPVPAGTKGAKHDLNTLIITCRWDKKLKRYVKP